MPHFVSKSDASLEPIAYGLPGRDELPAAVGTKPSVATKARDPRPNCRKRGRRSGRSEIGVVETYVKQHLWRIVLRASGGGCVMRFLL
jgi:hypothetical protein